MKEKDFIFWLKGFVSACNSHMPTPAQWDILVDTLKEVEDGEKRMIKPNSITRGSSDTYVVTPHQPENHSLYSLDSIKFFTTTTGQAMITNDNQEEDTKIF